MPVGCVHDKPYGTVFIPIPNPMLALARGMLGLSTHTFWESWIFSL
jgi:hypothetical protein